MRLFILLTLLVFTGLLQGQKEITLEDIWTKGTFNTRSIPGFLYDKSGSEYLRRIGNNMEKFDIRTGEKTGVLLQGDSLTDKTGKTIRYSSYLRSSDGRYFLLETEMESIYRYSKKAFYILYDTKTSDIFKLYPQSKQMYPAFSPDSKKIAFVSDNNLYTLDIDSKKRTQVTTDGKYNHIINGASDWVYEEEFALKRAYEWSLDSRHIAFIRFDETEVPEFFMELYNDDAYPEKVTFKYPKVGEVNAVVSLHIHDLNSKKTLKGDLGDLDDQYIPRIKWSSKGLIAFKMNRHQNHLQLFMVNSSTGKSKLIMEEKNKYYIDIHDDMTFVESGNAFVWSSEQDGYQHLYLYDLDGKLKRQISSGRYDVTNFYGVDEKTGKLYFQAAMESPMEREVYEIGLDGSGLRKISTRKGTNSAQFSPNFEYFVNTFSTINSAPVYEVYDRKGGLIRQIETNSHIIEIQENYQVSPVEFFEIRTSEDVQLNAYRILPANFDPSKKYPVFMFLYGGPNSQQVTDNWKATNYWWFQLLAQKGYMVVCVDNRGTGARGEEFRKMTYMQLGHFETIDQIESARYLATLPYVDGSRIGIYGWSYGGYMSSLCLLKGNDVFKAAIAVAPVTNWKWYDTIYTERYMRTSAENPEGYKQNSPVYFADRLKGKYLLIHGMADDNVHFQNTVEMANALITANKQFDTYYYPNRNHGIYGGNARIHLFTKMTQFILDNI
jgi:dipeptidyl-peptidase 4